MATLVRYNRAPLFVNPFFRPAVTRYYKTNANVPAVNVKDIETAYVLEVAAPGLNKDAVKVNVENNTLTIAYQPETTAEANETFTRHEFGLDAFSRSFRLPKTVNADAINARYTDGILIVELPKVEVKEENLVREITIA